MAYNVTSNSTSKQLYVGVDEIYAAPDPVALPGSLCTDNCQKVVSLLSVLPHLLKQSWQHCTSPHALASVHVSQP